MPDILSRLIFSIWAVVLASADWLIYGILIASIIKLFLSAEKISKHLKEPSLKSVIKASAFGIPLPLCSCSVIPVALMLKKSGASRGAVGSFLVSTPEIGVDSFLLSYGLLGPVITTIRLVASAISAFFVGFFINLVDDSPSSEALQEEQNNSCCMSKETPQKLSVFSRINSVIRFGLVDLIDDMSVSLLIGFICSGLVATFIPADYSINENFSAATQMFLMLVISIPLYVCATSSTPIAAMLLYKGMSPGAIIVFLLAGPATNLATVFVVKNHLGKKAFYIYLLTIIVTTLIFGVFANIFVGQFMLTTNYENFLHPHQQTPFFAYILISLLLFSYYKKVRRLFVSKVIKKNCCNQ